MLISFLFLDENICYGYSLEVPRQGASNEYLQHMFSSRNKKNIMWIPPLICSYVNVQANLCLHCLQVPKDTFSNGVTHIKETDLFLKTKY